jgi:cysteine synthase
VRTSRNSPAPGISSTATRTRRWPAEYLPGIFDASRVHQVIVAIVCDRGDRYLSTGVFNG